MSIALSTLIPLSFADAKHNLIEPFINTCRLCMWKREKMIYFGQRVDIISKINACLPTSVSDTDELSKYICCQCFYKLNMLYEFHKMCARTDFILRSYFKSRSKVPETDNDNCANAIQLFEQSFNSNHDAQDSSNEQCSEIVTTKQHEISLFCGAKKLTSNSKENETVLPRKQIMENKFNRYVLDKKHKTIECCNNNEVEGNDHSENDNILKEVIDMVKDKIFSEDGTSEFLCDQGLHLNIESVYTVGSENKENVCLTQSGQLSEQLDCNKNPASENKGTNSLLQSDQPRETREEHLDLNMNSKSLDETGTSAVGEERNSISSDVCHGEKKLENLKSEISSNEEAVTFARKTMHDEVCPSVNHTDEGVENGAYNADCPGYSSTSLQQQILQDSHIRIKTEFKRSSYSDSLKQNASNNLQPESLNSIISESNPRDSKTKVLLPNIWKQCFKLQGQKSAQDSKLNQCKRCQKILKSAYSLRRHMLVHTGVKPYKCPFCVRSFAFGFGFSVHIRTHTGERPFKCCECSKEFMDKPSLITHMRKHTGIRPYKCNICYKQFYTNASLNSHRKVHSQLHAFSCCECSKDFKRYYSLNLHMRLHTGFRPYKCPECDHTFIKCAHLKQHLRVHTGYKPFKCVKCSKCFSQYSNYRSHIRKHVKGMKVENNVVCF